MALLVYSAKRSLLPHHSVNQLVSLDIGITEAGRSRSVTKNVQRSMGGAMETLWHRADVEWQITFEPVCGTALDQLVEFLDSTESGETFKLMMYGTESDVLNVKRIDDGYELSPFMRLGDVRRDYYQASIKVLVV